MTLEKYKCSVDTRIHMYLNFIIHRAYYPAQAAAAIERAQRLLGQNANARGPAPLPTSGGATDGSKGHANTLTVPSIRAWSATSEEDTTTQGTNDAPVLP